jgi:hypothetical protein
VRGEEFQRHTTLELEVLGLVDDPHPAPADLLKDTILPGDEGVLGETVGGGVTKVFVREAPSEPAGLNGAAQLLQKRESSLFSA